MINDLNHWDGAVIETTICIIGSGAAGISLALEFINSGTDVTMLESGGKLYEPQTQSLYDSNIVGLPHNSIHAGRGRILGGTTTLWAGQALPLNEIDFERRDWVDRSGWGFTRQDLAPYYRRAEVVMNLPASSYDGDQWCKSHLPAPEFDHQSLEAVISQFSPTPNFGQRYYQELLAATNINVLLHANAINIHTKPDSNAVEWVDVKSLGGKTAQIKAKYYVICCGAIETARLLLASNRIEANGLGNQYDLVGRYFQEHLQYPVGPITPQQRRVFNRTFTAHKYRGIKYHPQFAFAAHAQEQFQVLNAVGGIYYPPSADSAIEAVKVVLKALKQKHLRRQLPKALFNILRHPNQLIAAAYRYLILRQPAQDTSGMPHLGIATEQQPNPDSQIGRAHV